MVMCCYALSIVVVPSAAAGTTVSQTFTYSSSTQTFTVPANVAQLTLTITGGEGGRGGTDASGRPPLGGYQGVVSGTISVAPGQTLTIGVGQAGQEPGNPACIAGVSSGTPGTNGSAGGTNPLGGFGGGIGGSPGQSGCSGEGGGGGAASVVEIGTAGSPASVATLVAGGSGGSGGSGQFTPTLGQISLPTYQARSDATSTNGQAGIDVYAACSVPGSTSCDGGGGAGGGGGAQGGSQGLVEFGSGTSDEWFGLGGYPGENSVGGLSGLSASYSFYADDESNGSVTVSYSTGVPGAPSGVGGAPGNSSASIYWTAPAVAGLTSVSDYLVQYSSNGGSTWSSPIDTASTTTSATVTGLTNGTGYIFQVAAVNSIGQGLWSASSGTVTPSGPPDAPVITSITPSDGSLSVAFSAANSSQPITDYDYSLDGGTTWVSTGDTASPIVIAGLTNGTSYSVELRGVNGDGGGAASAPSSGTPSALPGAPTITAITSTTATSLTVSVIAGYNGGSALTNYQYSTDGGATWQLRTDGGTTSSSILITALSTNGTTPLSSGVTYPVEIRALNISGNGPGSAFAAGVTLAVADAPSITLTPLDSSIQVAYSPYTVANDGGSPLSGVDYSLDGGTTWVSAGTLANPFTISGLTNGTLYNVLLRADNAIGSSVASTSASATPRTVPNAPTQISVVAGSSSLQATWVAPVNNGGATVSGYTASVFAALTDGSAISTCTSATLTCTLSGLTNGTTYYISVIATNVAGNSTPSSPRVAAIPLAAPGAPTLTGVTAGDSYLSISFTAGSAGNDPITSYQYTLDGGTTWLNASGTTSPIVISSLVDGTNYTVSLRALSAAGAGATSTNSETGVPYAAPDPTANATTTYTASSGAVTVSWVAPNNNGSAIASYVVTAFSSLNAGSPISTCTTSTLSCQLTGLTNGTIYYISIQSENVNSEFSLRSSPRIPVVSGSASTTTLASLPTSSNFATSVTLTATVTTGATGTVSFEDGGVTITGCGAQTVNASHQATCTTTALPTGLNTLLAAYSGNSTFASSTSSSMNFTVSVASQSALTLTSTSTTFALSPANTLSLTTSGGTTGGVVTYVVSPTGNGAGCTISGSTLTYTSVGSCSVTATMAGNTNYAGVHSLATTISVAQSSSSTTLASAPTSSNFGTSVTLTATVTTGATGTVNFEVGGVSISGCSSRTLNGSFQATCTTTALPGGSNSLRALYSGDANYATSTSSTTTLVVGAANQSALTITSTSTNYVPSPSNTTTLVTSGGSSLGAVSYVVSPTGNTAGCSVVGATLTYTSVGSCSLTATMAGNSNYNSVSSSATSFGVGLATSITTLLSSPTSSVHGASVTLTATVTSSATGTVNFEIGGVSIAGCWAVALSGSSQAACTTSALPTGLDVLSANYSGDSTYASSSSVPLSFGVGVVVKSTTPPPVVVPPTNSGPSDVLVVSTATALNLSWTAPDPSGGVVVSYTVTVTSGTTTESCTTTTTNCTIKGLSVHTSYSVTVVANYSSHASAPTLTNARTAAGPAPKWSTIEPFGSNSSAARAVITRIVDHLAHVVVQLEATRVTLTGYTDNQGTQGANRILGHSRSLEVAKLLKADLARLGDHGVRILSLGKGAVDFVSSNATSSGRARNRRVVAEILS
jgi:titin